MRPLVVGLLVTALLWAGLVASSTQAGAVGLLKTESASPTPFGVKYLRAEAQGARVPSSPYRLHATSFSGRATLDWTYPISTGGALINRYQVKQGTFARNVPARTRSYTFTGLRNGAFYSLYVRAHNSAGFSKWARVGARPNTPVFYDCDAGHRQPINFQLACGDGNGYFDRAHWTHWNGTYATGTARLWYNTCLPSCAEGNYQLFTVKTALDRVRVYRGHTYFSRFRYGRTDLIWTYPLVPL
jgi:hypothetical protein